MLFNRLFVARATTVIPIRDISIVCAFTAGVRPAIICRSCVFKTVPKRFARNRTLYALQMKAERNNNKIAFSFWNFVSFICTLLLFINQCRNIVLIDAQLPTTGFLALYAFYRRRVYVVHTRLFMLFNADYRLLYK